MIRACLCALANWANWLAFLAAGYGTILVAYSFYRSVFGVRAKRRATTAIQHALASDPTFRALVDGSQGRAWTAEEVTQIRELIRIYTRQLSMGDRKVVDDGLKQNSARGVRRFVGEVVGHKLAA